MNEDVLVDSKAQCPDSEKGKEARWRLNIEYRNNGVPVH
jgi:hypothetical protein